MTNIAMKGMLLLGVGRMFVFILICGVCNTAGAAVYNRQH